MTGTLELLCGPSGVGKTTSARGKTYRYQTRLPREKLDNGILVPSKELVGLDDIVYSLKDALEIIHFKGIFRSKHAGSFVSPNYFEVLRQDGFFVGVHRYPDPETGDWYGYPRQEILDALVRGEHVTEQIVDPKPISELEEAFKEHSFSKHLFLTLATHLDRQLRKRGHSDRSFYSEQENFLWYQDNYASFDSLKFNLYGKEFFDDVLDYVQTEFAVRLAIQIYAIVSTGNNKSRKIYVYDPNEGHNMVGYQEINHRPLTEFSDLRSSMPSVDKYFSFLKRVMSDSSNVLKKSVNRVSSVDFLIENLNLEDYLSDSSSQEDREMAEFTRSFMNVLKQKDWELIVPFRYYCSVDETDQFKERAVEEQYCMMFEASRSLGFYFLVDNLTRLTDNPLGVATFLSQGLFIPYLMAENYVFLNQPEKAKKVLEENYGSVVDVYREHDLINRSSLLRSIISSNPFEMSELSLHKESYLDVYRRDFLPSYKQNPLFRNVNFENPKVFLVLTLLKGFQSIEDYGRLIPQEPIPRQEIILD